MSGIWWHVEGMAYTKEGDVYRINGSVPAETKEAAAQQALVGFVRLYGVTEGALFWKDDEPPVIFAAKWRAPLAARRLCSGKDDEPPVIYPKGEQEREGGEA